MLFPFLVALFIVVPLVELAVLLRVGQAFGLARTLVLVVVTGVVGAALARAQGTRVLAEIRREMAEGRVPGPMLLDGMMILAAGAMLITPGLVTDIAGLLLLVPGCRREVRVWLRRWFEARLLNGPAARPGGE